MKLERRVTAGFSMLVSWTHSKLIDDVAATATGFPGESFGTDNIQNYNNRRGERAVASFDTPDYLAINAVYELPFGPGKSVANVRGPVGKIIGGWQVNGIATFSSGAPLALSTASNNLFNFDGVQRPNWNGQDPNLPGPASSRLGRYFDTSVFSQP